MNTNLADCATVSPAFGVEGPTPRDGGAGRRRSPLQEARQTRRGPVRWDARYSLDGEADYGWRTCTLVDVSPSGAGVDLHDVGPDDAHNSGQTPRTCRLVMAIELNEGEVPVFGWFTQGRVANVRSGDGARLRVGVEFVDLTALELDVLDAVVQITTNRLPELDPSTTR